ncbi:hypothetical protein E5940_002959 [Enterococcus faecalis]|nr:hypothetical protein [Enterococcus faecalis]EGO8163073.1 hypothetical protein [Enterococcus faecalis]
MTKKKVVIGLGLLAGVTGLVACEFKKKERLNRLEDTLSGLVFTQESMLRYQAEKNEDYEDRLESLVFEVSDVYGHIEALANLKEETK